MKRLFTQKQNYQDYSKYLGEVPQTRKQRLLVDCIKSDVSIYSDNPSEQPSGIHAELRGVVSEAELVVRAGRSFFPSPQFIILKAGKDCSHITGL